MRINIYMIISSHRDIFIDIYVKMNDNYLISCITAYRNEYEVEETEK